jgi:hypothetical protein
LWCEDGVWVAMRAGVQASDAMIVWVGRVVCSLCSAWGVREAVGMLWGSLGVGRCGALAREGQLWWCAGVVCVLFVWDGCCRGVMLGECRRWMG